MKQLQKNLKGFCFKCKLRLIVPSWKYCQDCDIHAVKHIESKNKNFEKMVKSFTLQNFRDVTKLYTIQEHIKNKNLSEKKVLVYDENNVIIGYK